MNEPCECCTWDHAVQAFDVLLGYSALCAHLVDEAGNKPDHRVGYITVLWVLKPTFRIKALCHAAGNAVKQTWWQNENEKGQALMSRRIFDLRCESCVLTQRDLKMHCDKEQWRWEWFSGWRVLSVDVCINCSDSFSQGECFTCADDATSLLNA